MHERGWAWLSVASALRLAVLRGLVSPAALMEPCMPAAAPASLVPLPDLPLEDVCRHREVGVLKTAISAWPCLTFLHSGFSNSCQVSLEALSGAGLVQK